VAASVIDFILDGLEAELELERELGVRTVEIDRALLASPSPTPSPSPSPTPTPTPTTRSHELVFVHDGPLSPAGVEMMAKIVVALGRTADNTPIVITSPVPKAKIVVVLGCRAMRANFPSLRAEPGQWHRTTDGTDVLITYSPEYILRFGKVTSAVKKLKEEMWRSLKVVKQRLEVKSS